MIIIITTKVVRPFEPITWAKPFCVSSDTILFSPVYNKIEPKTMVEWIMKDNLNVRFQMQLHKEVWPESVRGV